MLGAGNLHGKAQPSGVLDFLPAALAGDEEGKEQSVVRSADWMCMGVVHGLGGSLWNPDLADFPRRTLGSKKGGFTRRRRLGPSLATISKLEQMP